MDKIIGDLRRELNAIFDLLSGYSGTRQDKKVVQTLFNSFILVLFIIITGCNKNKSDTTPAPPPIDISGAWAGTWSGYDPGFGQVSGNWEAEVTQSASSITGFGTVDCLAP